MNTVLKISLLSTGILASTALFAQTTTPTADPNAAAPAPAAGVGMPGQGLLFRRAALRHYVVKQLGLSPDQITQLKTIRANTRASIQSIRADTSLNPDQQKAKIHETWEAGRAQMRAVLTPDQQAKLDQMRRNARRAFDL